MGSLSAVLKLMAVVLLLMGGIHFAFLRPPTHPRNIPAVPFWVVLLPFFFDVDQEETFKRYIQDPLLKHGAVKIFFGAQWNILVQRPEYVAQIFKNEDLYQKSGNQKKIPHSVLAEFLGDNIISAHGESWKLYQKVVKPGLQGRFEVQPILSNALQLAGLVREAQDSVGHKGGIPVQQLLQRYTIANAAQCLHQADFGTMTSDESRLDKLQMAVKLHIFRPIFMNFPVLDRLPLRSRRRAREAVRELSSELLETIKASHLHCGKPCSPDSDRLGCRLLASHQSGILSDRQLRDNINVTFVAGQENPQLALISTLYLLAKHRDVQEALGGAVGVIEPTITALSEMPLLTAVILESLRLFPPIGQLINRKVHGVGFLGDGGESVFVPDGSYIGYNCYATNRDPHVWKDAEQFVPSRWGQTSEEIARRYRRAKMKAEFTTFHGGRRACLGERFALLQLRVTLWALLRQWQWGLDPSWKERMTPAGPLYPRQLRLSFTARELKMPFGVHSDDGALGGL
ncbi:hypothetical protein MKZ38_001885 [Zalerion maritima]|uniref:Cytochrome P450 n=1 Tax=Zalerion maritima TaxID=339359 RepID=A0AAD5RPS2_9PEZI|nr:hypothetical protein MKZ38_001885 [Zalerion maritima]